MPGALGIVFELFGWFSVLLDIAGLLICVRYLRLSSSMPLLVLAFAGFTASAIGSRLLTYGANMNLFPSGDVQISAVAVLNLVHIVCSATLIIGLALVFRDIRERFHYIREAYETDRERSARQPGVEDAGV